MAQELGFAREYARLLTAALERGDRERSLYYIDKIQSLLLRAEPQELIFNLEQRNDHARLDLLRTAPETQTVPA